MPNPVSLTPAPDTQGPWSPGPECGSGWALLPRGRLLAVSGPAQAPPRVPPEPTAGAGPARRPRPRPPPPAVTRPPPAAAPAGARYLASPSPCGAARLGPVRTPQSPRRLPGPPCSAHVTRRRRLSFKQLYRQQPGQTATRPRGGTGPGAVFRTRPGPAPARAPPDFPGPAPCPGCGGDWSACSHQPPGGLRSHRRVAPTARRGSL